MNAWIKMYIKDYSIVHGHGHVYLAKLSFGYNINYIFTDINQFTNLLFVQHLLFSMLNKLNIANVVLVNSITWTYPPC